MKHRLPIQPLTQEDEEIWWLVRRRFPTYPTASLEIEASWADKRDAALMWSMVGISEQFSTFDRHDVLAFYFAGGPVL